MAAPPHENEVKEPSKSLVSNTCEFGGESLKAEYAEVPVLCLRLLRLPPAIACIHTSQRKYAITDNMITETLGVVRSRALAVG